jgi:hypothetical protein
MKCVVFWDITFCSPVSQPTFRKIFHHHVQVQRVRLGRNRHEAGSKLVLLYSSTLKMEIIFSSETSVEFHWTAECYISEDVLDSFLYVCQSAYLVSGQPIVGSSVSRNGMLSDRYKSADANSPPWAVSYVSFALVLLLFTASTIYIGGTR